jgi:hypothetical protein
MTAKRLRILQVPFDHITDSGFKRAAVAESGLRVPIVPDFNHLRDVDLNKVNRRMIGRGLSGVQRPWIRATYIERTTNMQFLLLLYENEQRFSQGFVEAEMAEYQAFGKQFAQAIKGGNALQPTATAATVRVRDGKQLATDGPFAETKEQLGGYYLIEAKDRDEAVAIAAKLPGARFGGVEVRPIMTFS